MCACEFDYKGIKQNKWMNLKNNSVSRQRLSAGIVVRILYYYCESVAAAAAAMAASGLTARVLCR